MATPVQDVYKIFLSQIGKDILSELDQEIAEDIMLTYLEGATVEFDKCNKDLTIENSYIIGDLELDEKFILSDAMILYWLKPKIHTQEVIKNRITDKDYSINSPANLLDKLIKLQEQCEKRLAKRLRKYSWKNKKVNG